MQRHYKRILLKLSGEALMGDDSFGINTDVLDFVADEVKTVVELGVQPGIVIGAGNIFRGVAGASKGMDRTTADNMGMLATVMNSLAMQDALERKGVLTRVMSGKPLLYHRFGRRSPGSRDRCRPDYQGDQGGRRL